MEIKDKKVGQARLMDLADPFIQDLTVYYKLMLDDILKTIEAGNHENPEQIIDQIDTLLTRGTPNA